MGCQGTPERLKVRHCHQSWSSRPLPPPPLLLSPTDPTTHYKQRSDTGVCFKDWGQEHQEGEQRSDTPDAVWSVICVRDLRNQNLRSDIWILFKDLGICHQDDFKGKEGCSGPSFKKRYKYFIADQNPHPSRCLSLLVTLQLRFPDLWRVWDSPCGGGLVDLWRAPTEPESRLHSSDPAKLETLIQGTLRLTVGGQDGAPASRIHQTSEPGETEPGRPLCDL